MRSPTSRHPEDEAAIDAFVHHVIAVAGRSRDTGGRHRWNLRRFLAWCRDRGLEARVETAADIAAYLYDYACGRALSSSAIASVIGSLRPCYDHLCPVRPVRHRDLG